MLAAQALLAAQHWSSAYYLAGYAVEFGLKSCILAHVGRTGAIFVDKKFSEKCWSHDVKALLALAQLQDRMEADCRANLALDSNWQVVIEWNEMSRYEIITQADAEVLFRAITHDINGVLTWMKVYW